MDSITNSSATPPLRFSLLLCILLDFPESRLDCSLTDSDNCVRCGILGSYFTSDGVDDFGSTGHVVSIVLWLLTMLLASFGTITNSLIIAILLRKKTRGVFDILLLSLASFDLLCCISAFVGSTAFVAFTDNWSGRGLSALIFYAWSCFAAYFCRSGSAFMTVLITIERFVVITFPAKSLSWFTPRKTKFMVLGVLLLAAFINIPWFLSVTITENDIGADILSIHKLPYVIKPTYLGKVWYQKVARYHDLIDFWLPLPVLLLVNLGSYWGVRQFSAKRKELNVKQRKDINAVNMFLPVVVVFFISNIEPIIYVALLETDGIAYRELYLGVLLSTAFNAAANLPIYYFKGSSFRREVRKLLGQWFNMQFLDDKGAVSTTTGTTSASETKEEIPL